MRYHDDIVNKINKQKKTNSYTVPDIFNKYH